MAVIIGTTGNDTLFGTSASDQIFGGTGNDFISGGGGSDQLSGGAGNDTLMNDGNVMSAMIGGTGADVFRFSRYSLDDDEAPREQSVLIVDFVSGVDKLLVIGGDFDPDIEVAGDMLIVTFDSMGVTSTFYLNNAAANGFSVATDVVFV